MASMSKPVTAPDIRHRKVRDGHDPLVMVTAYDAPGARIADEAGVDLILVGDSVAMVVLGYEDTLQVTIDDLAHHTRNAAQLIRAGAGSVKLEGGQKRLRMIEAILDAEMPVMGHLGLTPQSIKAMGGFKVQAKAHQAALDLVADAKALTHAGCFAIVLEGVPTEVAQMVTEAVDVPTIGIGAGPGCDGQVLVAHDLLGIEDRISPKFVRRYGSMKDEMVAAMAHFADDVRGGTFPSDDESYHLSDEVAETLGLYGRAG
jgi:3-methyl-2-oxobutanoate hydroxymethyltransferase